MTRTRCQLHMVCALLALVVGAAPSFARAEETGAAAAPDAGAAVSSEDEKLLKEIEAAGRGPSGQAAPPTEAAPPPPGPKRGTGSAFSNIFNPAMSANGLLLGSLGAPVRRPRKVEGSFALQEVEIQLASNVDPYFSANLILALPSGESLGIEEGYLTAIPHLAGISFRAGKIKAPFGRENAIHTHALPFVDKSLVGTAALGEEGLDAPGVEAALLLPLPWYSLVTVTALDGRDQALFGAPDVGKAAGFAGLRNVVDLTDDSTLEAGASYAAGRGLSSRLGQALGAHLTFKWKPARDAMNSSAVVALEGLLARKPEPELVAEGPVPHEPAGLCGYLQWQLTRGWFVGGRFDYLTDLGMRSLVTTRESVVLVFAPTEFSAFRLQLGAAKPPGGEPFVVTGLLQANFTIGAHPAHAY